MNLAIIYIFFLETSLLRGVHIINESLSSPTISEAADREVVLDISD